MPLAARSWSQSGYARASETRFSFYACCSITSSSNPRREVIRAANRKRSSSSSIAPSPLSIKPSLFHFNSRPGAGRRSVARFASAMDSSRLYLGIDMGTSGGRAMVIDGEGVFIFVFLFRRRCLFRPPLSYHPPLFPSSDSGTVVATAKKGLPCPSARRDRSARLGRDLGARPRRSLGRALQKKFFFFLFDECPRSRRLCRRGWNLCLDAAGRCRE